MSKHPIYALLYIILLPFACLLGLSALSYLLMATQAPAFLIAAFIAGCFTIYTVATFIFYIKAIQRQQLCKPALRDWIRVNAFVILLPTLVILVEGIAVVANPGLMDNALQKLQEMQEQKLPFTSGAIRALLYVFAVYAAALFVHIIYTFRLLKTYQSSFEPSPLDNL